MNEEAGGEAYHFFLVKLFKYQVVASYSGRDRTTCPSPKSVDTQKPFLPDPGEVLDSYTFSI